MRTLADVPEKPRAPGFRVISASKAMLTFYRQNRIEENGSPVNKIAVEQQIKRTEQAATKWTVVKEHPLIDSSQSDIISNVELPVELINLTEHAISCYRVVTVNSIGRSEPSQAVEIYPESIIPGSPEMLEVTKQFYNYFLEKTEN